ncbi:MAG: hypothetical protein JXA78_16845 [Anaerolineales bacterium]|nr:hypothetical protein [Anaerolineales bacterium]
MIPFTRINWRPARKAYGVLLAIGLLLGGWATSPVPQSASLSAPQNGILVGEVASFPDGSDPAALIYGPQEALWFTLLGANAIAKLSPLDPPGAVVSTTLPTAGAEPYDLTIGPDQALWFSQQAGNQIGRMDLASMPPSISDFPLATPGAQPGQMVLGQDGGVWFTQWIAGKIGRIDPGGSITDYPLSNPNSRPLGIAVALNGDIWFTEWAVERIGRLTPQGELYEYDLSGLLTAPEMRAYVEDVGAPTALQPTEIVLGPDGNLWFVFSNGTSIVRLDPDSAQMTPYNLGTASAGFLDLAIGPDGRLWYLAIQHIGSFEVTPDGPANLVEVDIPPMFEGEGRTQLIAGPGEEMYFIRLDSQSVYSATVEAAPLRELQTFINNMPDSLLAAGEFEMAVEIWNRSEAAATNVQVELDLSDYIDYLSVSDPAVSCVQNLSQVLCQLGDLPASSSLPFTYTLNTRDIDVEQVEWSLSMEAHSDESDYLPANNRQIRFLTIDRIFRYFNDFSAGSDEHWSHASTDNPSAGLIYLGPFDNQRVTLGFENLPPHDWADLCFDLYILGAWDGSHLVDPLGGDAPLQVVGPDLWSLYLDQDQRLVTSFSNRAELNQAFPADYPGDLSLAQTMAVEVGNFDRDAATIDARYHLCYQQRHTASNLLVTFYGLNLDALLGEAWALDNVDLKIFYKAVFDWIYLPLVVR